MTKPDPTIGGYSVSIIRKPNGDRWGLYKDGVLIATFHSRAGARRDAERREALARAQAR